VHVTGGKEYAGNGAAADQGMEFIEVAVADDQMAAELFQRSRIGIEHLVAYQMKTRLQR
jgi:hypothetical protein